MKFLLPLFVALVVLIGLGSALTPLIAELLLPVPEVMVKKAEPQEVADALHQWFDAAPDVRFTETEGLNRSENSGRVSWMRFNVGADTVSRFIHRRGLKQKPLDETVLDGVFSRGKVPAEWWQPEELGRQTWFAGVDAGRDVGLIYNAEMQRGYLVARTLPNTRQ